MGRQNHRSTPFWGDFIGWIMPQIYSQACQVGPADQDVVVGVFKILKCQIAISKWGSNVFMFSFWLTDFACGLRSGLAVVLRATGNLPISETGGLVFPCSP